MRMQLDAETSDVLEHDQQHVARVIGRLLASQARKQAAPSAKLDPTIGKIEVQYCCHSVT